jgi:hypothetical protein
MTANAMQGDREECLAARNGRLRRQAESAVDALGRGVLLTAAPTSWPLERRRRKPKARSATPARHSSVRSSERASGALVDAGLRPLRAAELAPRCTSSRSRKRAALLGAQRVCCWVVDGA